MSMTTVSEVSEFIRGITFKPTDLIEQDDPDAVVCMRTKNIQEDLDETDLIAVPSSFVRQDRKYLKPGDTLISSANSWDLVGKCTYVPELDYPATAGGFIAIVRPKEHTHPRFLYHWLNNPRTQHIVRHLGRQTTNISNLDVNRFKSVELPDLSFEEQSRIAAILDKADAIRRKREQALTLADDFLKSVFLEMFGDPSENPKNYPVENFASILSIPLRNGISPSSRGTVLARVITLSAITGDHFDEEQEKEGKFLVPISAKDTVDASDFYICRGNGSPDLIGKGFYATQTIPGTAFPDTMIAAKPNPKKVTRAFLEGIWNSPFVRNQILEAARTTNGTFKINQTAAGAIKLPMPPMEAQKRFQTIVDQVRQSNEKLKFGDDLFPSLSQRAFNGDL